ncbi:MAG: hypothetical protein AAB414_03080 [Patescibacteria group bacterium]
MREIDDPKFVADLTWGIPVQGLELRMKPDHASEVGFLGEDESLLEVVHSDWVTVVDLGTTHGRIGESLMDLLKGGGSLAPGFEYRSKWEIEDIRTEVLGEQGCPWKCTDRGLTEGVIARTETFQESREEITSAVSDFFYNRTPDSANLFVVVTGLLPHLIRQHFFFEGRQSPYRAEPSLLIQAFGLKR